MVLRVDMVIIRSVEEAAECGAECPICSEEV